MRKSGLIALALLAACSQPSANKDDFTFAAAVEPQKGAMVQRIALPGGALAAIKREDLGDVRLLDAHGKTLPLARLDQTGTEAVTRREVPLYPIAFGPESQGTPAVSISVAQPGQTISVEASGSAALPGMSAALLDNRALDEPVVGLDLDIDLPAQSPITFTLEVSNDLKSWDLLAEKVLFSPAKGQMPLGGARIALPGSDLTQRYLRLSWKTQAGVTLRGAALETAKAAPVPSIALASTGAVQDDAHNLRLSLSTPAPLTGIELASRRADGMVPVRLYGRQAQERPWQPLAAATLRGDDRPARFDLPGSTFRQYKVEADQRSGGFSAPPAVTVHLQPMVLLGAFNGEAPYRLVAGNAAAEGKYFTPADLTDGKVQASDLPFAKLAPSALPVIELSAGAADSPFAPRKLALWAALLLGTAVLAWGAMRLLRANADDQPAS